MIPLILCGFIMSSCNTTNVLNSQLQNKVPPTSRAIIFSKKVVIQAPSGFCIDETVSKITSKPAFILFGNCAAIAQSNSIYQSKVSAVLTATVSKIKSDESSFESKHLDTYLRSKSGRELLSMSGDSNNITVLDSFKMDSSYFVLVKNTGEKASKGISDYSWRAYLQITGHLIVVSIIGFTNNPMTHDQSLKIIRHFVNDIRINNGLSPTLVPIDYIKKI